MKYRGSTTEIQRQHKIRRIQRQSPPKISTTPHGHHTTTHQSPSPISSSCKDSGEEHGRNQEKERAPAETGGEEDGNGITRSCERGGRNDEEDWGSSRVPADFGSRRMPSASETPPSAIRAIPADSSSRAAARGGAAARA